MEFNFLYWQCRRGMAELELILIKFLKKHYMDWTLLERKNFAKLLKCSDQDLLNWLLGEELPEDLNLQQMILLIKQ